MSEIREMQLEIVKMISDVDKLFSENGIEYTLLGGSVLGAIRHKGFIPWDDDMDIGVKRNDYAKAEKLLATMNKYVYEPFNDHVVPDGPLGHLHLVNDKYPIDNSPTIDVFALDGVPDNKKKWKHLKTVANWYHLGILGRPAYNRGIVKRILTWLALVCIPKFLWEKIKKNSLSFITSFDVTKAKYIGNIWGAWGFKEWFPREMYDIHSVGDFEGLKLPLPKDPDAYLTQMYGNYMELPPIEKQVPKHRSF